MPGAWYSRDVVLVRVIIFYIVLCIIVLAFSASAKEEFRLPDAGTTPESPFYALDLFNEQMRLFFTLNDTRRLERRISSANERLAEAHQLAGKGVVAVKKSLELYQEQWADAETAAILTQDAQHMANTARLVNLHFPYLDRISERTPVEDRRFAQLAKEYIIDGHIDMIHELLQKNKEAATDIFLEAVSKRFDRIIAVAIDENSIGEALREYEKYILAGQALPDDARHRLISQTSGHSMKLDTEVRDKIRPQAELQLRNTINSLRALHTVPAFQ